jgi:hypothetical protein
VGGLPDDVDFELIEHSENCIKMKFDKLEGKKFLIANY